MLTTREVRDAENKMIQLAAEGQAKHEALNGGKEWVVRNPFVGGSEEQSKAVCHVLGSKDFVISFKGPAGAGKTQLMTEAVTAIEALSGKRVLVLAPSSASVQVLRAQGFTNAETLQQFQVNSNLQEQIKGQVVWVDEAGFLSVRQMLELQEFALHHNCRLILTGDTKQSSSLARRFCIFTPAFVHSGKRVSRRIPASINRRINSGELLAGPRVDNLVRRICDNGST